MQILQDVLGNLNFEIMKIVHSVILKPMFGKVFELFGLDDFPLYGVFVLLVISVQIFNNFYVG